MTSSISRSILLVSCSLLGPTTILSQAFEGAGGRALWRTRRSRRPSTVICKTMSSSSSSSSSKKKEYAPSQSSIDEANGEQWRLCAGAAVLNSKNQVLVGERLGVPGAWQCPQGGVDDTWTPEGETKPRPKEGIAEACTRELYEEMGLEVGTHVMVDSSSFPKQDEPENAVRYRTSGTSIWLTKAGFTGQELYWTVFRCMDACGDQDPIPMCDLSGNGGEDAEFSTVRWQAIDEVVANIWENKREPYEALQRLINENVGKWEEQIKSLDFSGKWARDHTKSSGVVEGLIGRGLAQEEAAEEAQRPYIQNWAQDSDDKTSWHVTTYQVDGITPRRELEYRQGEWDEYYQGKATIFGDAGESGYTLKRRTTYVAEPDAEAIPVAHVTVTDGPKGVEESRRYRKGDQFVLRRTLWPHSAPDSPITCTEIFIRSS
jgi:putative (di)nucleoside polyphosphate hydrolase